MKRILLTVMCLLIPCAVLADEPIKEVHGVLDLNATQKKLDNTAVGLGKVSTRVAALEQTAKELTDTDIVLNRRLMAVEKRLSTLEDAYINGGAKVDLAIKEHGRILSGKDGKGGIQKQINVLHAKVDALEAKAK